MHNVCIAEYYSNTHKGFCYLPASTQEKKTMVCFTVCNLQMNYMHKNGLHLHEKGSCLNANALCVKMSQSNVTETDTPAVVLTCIFHPQDPPAQIFCRTSAVCERYRRGQRASTQAAYYEGTCGGSRDCALFHLQTP